MCNVGGCRNERALVLVHSWSSQECVVHATEVMR